MSRNPRRPAFVLACLLGSAPEVLADAGAKPLALGQSFDAELVRDLPVHRLWTLFEIADATTVVEEIDGGGLYTGQPLRFSAHGASWTQVSYRLEGIDVTDPWGGTPLYLPDLQALHAVDLVTGAAPASVGGAGPVVELSLRRPLAAWTGALAGQVLPTGLQAQGAGAAEPLARFDHLRQAQFHLGGPLVPERLTLLLAGGARDAGRVEREDRVLGGRERSLLAQVLWTPGASDERRLLAIVQEARRGYAGRARFAGTAIEDDRYVHLQAGWTRRGPRHLAARAGYARGSFSPRLPASGETATVERLLDGPVPLLYDGDATRRRWSVGATLRPFAESAGARGGLELGGDLAWATSHTRTAGPRSPTAETVDGLPARVWDYGWAESGSRVKTFDTAAWVADRFRWRALDVEAGLRAETSRGSAEGGGEIRWTRLLPRLATRLTVPGLERFALRAGYAEYRARLLHPLLTHGDPGARQGLVHRWDDADGDGRLDGGEQGALVARVGPGGAHAAIDGGLRAPTTREVTVGVEARLAEGWEASLVGVSRRERDLPQVVNVGAPASAWDVTFLPDANKDILGVADDHLLPIHDRRPESFGQDAFLLTTHDGNVLHEGVELLVRGRAGARVRLLLAGTASRSEGAASHPGFRVVENDQGLPGDRLSPNSTVSERGRLFFDRAYTLNLLGTWRAPSGTRLGAAARYQDGQPYARLVIPTHLRQGPEPVQAQPERSRFTFTFTLDARVEQGFAVGRSRWAAAVEVLNLLDTSHEVEEDVVTGPAYRAVTAIQPPRAVVLELRAEF